MEVRVVYYFTVRIIIQYRVGRLALSRVVRGLNVCYAALIRYRRYSSKFPRCPVGAPYSEFPLRFLCLPCVPYPFCGAKISSCQPTVYQIFFCLCEAI